MNKRKLPPFDFKEKLSYNSVMFELLEKEFKSLTLKDGKGLLINDDCFNVFPKIPDKSVDAIICDLPYGTTQNKLDVRLPLGELWNEYKRIIKDNGIIILFAQGLFYVDLVNSNRKMFRYDIVWNKQLTTGFLNSNRMPLRCHENIAVFIKNYQHIIPNLRKENRYIPKATPTKKRNI
jgi:hypothetical protein